MISNHSLNSLHSSAASSAHDNNSHNRQQSSNSQDNETFHTSRESASPHSVNSNSVRSQSTNLTSGQFQNARLSSTTHQRANPAALQDMRLTIQRSNPFFDPSHQSSISSSRSMSSRSISSESLSSASSSAMDTSIDHEPPLPPMHQAVANSEYSTVRQLAIATEPQASEALEQFDANGFTPLMRACSEGDVRMVGLLLHYRANPNPEQTDTTPLKLAIEAGSPTICKRLLAAGATLPIDNPNSLNDNLLLKALHSENPKTAQPLIDFIASKEDTESTAGFQSLYTLLTGHPPFEKNALYCAADNRDLSMVEQLLTIGSGEGQKGEQLLDKTLDQLSRHRFGPTARYLNQLVGTLCNASLSLSTIGNDGTSPLRKAAQKGLADAARHLINNLSPYEINRRDPDGFNALHQAALNNQGAIVDLLLEVNSIEVDQTNNDNTTALHLAIAYGHQEPAESLLDAEANVNQRNASGDTPLHQAVMMESDDLIELLSYYDPNYREVNLQGLTPLHLAATLSHSASITKLLDSTEGKAALEATTPEPESQTALQLAVLHNQPHNIDKLLDAGANHRVMDMDGLNIRDIAITYGSNEALSTLLQKNLTYPMRNDQENVHDSLINRSLDRFLQTIKNSVDAEHLHPFASAYQTLLSHLQAHTQAHIQTHNQPLSHSLPHPQQNHPIPATLSTTTTATPAPAPSKAEQALHTINSEGTLPISHLCHEAEQIVETEQSVLAWVYSYILLQPADQQATLLESLIGRLDDCIDPTTGDPLCPGGRANRLLDTFSGLIPELTLASENLLNQEMLDKASNILREMTADQPRTTQRALNTRYPTPRQQMLINDFQQSLKEEIIDVLRADYVASGILNENELQTIISPWIDQIL